jgi:hypothetical protein
MSVGIFVLGSRPASKKAVKEAIAIDYENIYLENTSIVDNKFDVSLADKVAEGFEGRIDFVGPDPYTNRKFYGNIFVRAGKVTVK